MNSEILQSVYYGYSGARNDVVEEIENDIKQQMDDDDFIVYEDNEIKKAKKKLDRRLKRKTPKGKDSSKIIIEESISDTTTKKDQSDTLSVQTISSGKRKTRSMKKSRLVNLAGNDVQELCLLDAFDEDDANKVTESAKKRRIIDEEMAKPLEE
jgi:seryl-tRNA synthetase